jgi:uncharacterized membrane protein YoaK (UPF0700 family)
MTKPDPRPARDALLVVLSLVAGSTDTIGFLGLDGLFTNHVTGNLVILMAHIVDGGDTDAAKLLSVPVYAIVVVLATLLAGWLAERRLAPMRPLLLLHAILLVAFLVGAIGADRTVAGVLGIAAMAVQSATVQIAFGGSPPTAMMTGNLARLAVDFGVLASARHPERAATSRDRAVRTGYELAAFTVGCGLGAACESAFGLCAIILPCSLALLAFGLSFMAGPARLQMKSRAEAVTFGNNGSDES